MLDLFKAGRTMAEPPNALDEHFGIYTGGAMTTSVVEVCRPATDA
ncbi:hypothetical protein ACIBQ1_03450 [Nonomuraea sp. NPDC050153]